MVRTGALHDRKGNKWEKRRVFRKIFLFGKNEKFSNKRFRVKNTQKMEAVGKTRSSSEDGHAPCDRQIDKIGAAVKIPFYFFWVQVQFPKTHRTDGRK